MAKPYRKMKRLSRVDAAYIAGLIDGEGSLGLLRKHKTDSRQLVVTISNNELPMLEYVLHATGVGKITRKTPAKPYHTLNHTYTATNRQALALLEQVFEFLRTYKRQRAELIIENYVKLTPRNGKYTAQKLVQREAFIEKCMAIKGD